MGMGDGKKSGSDSVGSQSMGLGKKGNKGMSQSTDSLAARDMSMSSSSPSSVYTATAAGACVLVAGVAIVAYRRHQQYAGYTVPVEISNIAATEKAVLL